MLVPFEQAAKPAYILEPDKIFSTADIPDEEINELKKMSFSIPELKQHKKAVSTIQPDFLNQVNEIKKQISTGVVDKVVLSRILVLPSGDGFNPSVFFAEISALYPYAYKYIFFIPGEGCWIGATPEPLVAVKNGSVETASIAGTQKLNGVAVDDVVWQTKEMVEQRYVTHYIEKLLTDFGITDYVKRGPFSYKAANLIHLRSTFLFDMPGMEEKIGDFIAKLHPTPSVCGLPKKNALETIKQLELHEREYYTGFLGTLNMNGETNLYVNLRCLKWNDYILTFFAGAGITSGSVAESEWDETSQKLLTLLSVVERLQTSR